MINQFVTNMDMNKLAVMQGSLVCIYALVLTLRRIVK